MVQLLIAADADPNGIFTAKFWPEKKDLDALLAPGKAP